jgi:hypothetical protein
MTIRRFYFYEISGPRRNGVHITRAEKQLVIGDSRGAVVVDRRRKALDRIVRHLNELCRVIDGALDEGEQSFDGVAKPGIDLLAGLEIDHASHDIAEHRHVERMHVAAEAAALEGVGVAVQVLRAPALASGVVGAQRRGGGIERFELLARSGAVAA